MPDLKISELPAAGALTGAELVPAVQGGTTVQTTAQAIADLGSGGGGSGLTKMAMAVINNVGDFIVPEHPGVDSVVVLGTGEYQIVFTANYFGSSAVAVSCGMIENTPKVSWELTSFDNEQA